MQKVENYPKKDLKASANKDIIEKALKVSKEMLHKDIKMTQSYIRKD